MIFSVEYNIMCKTVLALYTWNKFIIIYSISVLISVGDHLLLNWFAWEFSVHYN